jgi:MFS family permease
VFFFDFGVSIYFFFFNLFLSGRGYSETQMGLVTASMAAGNLAGAFPAARLIQRIGLRNALISCVLSVPAVLCARSLSTWLPAQIGLAFLTGLTLCIWAVCVCPMTAAITTERERPRAFSLVFSLGIGVSAAGSLAGSRMPGWFSVRTGPAWALGADQLTLIAACLIALLAVIPAMKLDKGGNAVTPRAKLWSSSTLRRILPAVGIWGLVTGSFAPFANVFLTTHLRLPLHSVGMVFSVSQICQVAAVLCAPLVFRRLGVSNGVFAMQIATALCFILLALTPHPVAASMMYVALNGLQYMGEPGIYSLMMHLVPEESRPGASAAMAFVLGAAQLIAAAAAGWTFTNFGYPPALTMIAAIALAAGLLFRTASSSETHALVPAANERSGD